MTEFPHLGSAALHDAVRTVMVEASERAVMPRYRRLASHEVVEKGLDELVTVADRESEEILAIGLSKILPEAAIVGEEAADANPAMFGLLSGPLCWIVDPLDGTSNFAAGEGPFGILVALAALGEPIGGWIYDPRSGRFCCALRGEGMLIDGVPVSARASRGARPIVAISSLFLDAAQLTSTLVHGGNFTIVQIPRCAAEQYPRIILGINDVTLFDRTLPWDHAAGVTCLIEAGGQVTRLDGSPYRVDDDRRGLVASATPALGELVLNILQDWLPR